MSEQSILKPKGPGVFLAQFMGRPGFENLEAACKTAAANGYTCVQFPSWDKRVIDVETAATSQAYCDDINAAVKNWGLADGITELACHLQGQLMAAHPAYFHLFKKFAPEELRGATVRDTQTLYKWANAQLSLVIRASQKLGLKAIPSFTGSLLWPYIYPWPQPDQGMIKTGFKIIGNRWLPLFREAAEHGQKFAFELHPGEDVHDGDTLASFLENVSYHQAVAINYDPSHFVLMGLDYLDFIDNWHPRIAAYHVKDAEFNPTGNQGMYGAYMSWPQRAGRFRSLGDGQVKFTAIEDQLSVYKIDSISHVLEWECAIKGPDQGIREGAPFMHALINKAPLPKKVEPEKSDAKFDDFVEASVTPEIMAEMLGVEFEEVVGA